MDVTKKTVKLSNIIEVTLDELTSSKYYRNRLLCERAFGNVANHDDIFSDITFLHIGYNMENPANLLIRVSATMTETVHKDEDNGPLSMTALNWLESIGYKTKSYDELMLLVRAAKIAYPTTPEEDMLFTSLGMR